MIDQRSCRFLDGDGDVELAAALMQEENPRAARFFMERAIRRAWPGEHDGRRSKKYRPSPDAVRAFLESVAGTKDPLVQAAREFNVSTRTIERWRNA